MDGIFITGVDTGVGKSVVSAGILKMLQGGRKVCYWKPVQAGTIVSDDTKDIKTLTGLGDDCFLDPGYRFAEPLSPYMAAKKWGKRIDLHHLETLYQSRHKAGYFMVVEGAGGILVPFNDKELQIDLISMLKLPMLIIAEDRVGAINQTLLTVHAARERKIPLAGVILTKSRRTLGNAECISLFGKIEILMELDPTEDNRALVAQVGGNARMRELLNEKQLPN